ncbi:MAG: putative caspase-like protein [Paraglaciecola sp.]|jgi:uncharacterized caspase-like protein
MFKVALIFIVCFFLSIVALNVAASEQDLQRFALVIGNKNYASAPLKNAGNDANAMADNLSELGFRVSLVEDANLSDLAVQVQQFYAEIKANKHKHKLALVYYAGHAIQVNHNNYIVPLGLQFDSHQQFISGLYKVADLFTEINNIESLQSIIILDACRNNPFASNAIANNVNMSSGLAPIKAPSNTLIAFATEPGGVAADGKRKNGVYTKHLLRHMGKQISVEEIFKKVRAGVAKETRNRQIPWEHSSLLNEVFFSPPKNKNIPDLVVF